MKRTRIDSTAISAVGYDPQTAVLEIEFRTGELYRFFAVPPSAHRALLAAPSAGRFFGERIRGTYPEQHMRR